MHCSVTPAGTLELDNLENLWSVCDYWMKNHFNRALKKKTHITFSCLRVDINSVWNQDISNLRHVHLQVHSAVRRKLAQYRVQCRHRLVTTDSHSHNYHTNSSIVETSRGTLSLEHVPPQVDEDRTLTAMLVLNGQSNGKRSFSEEDHKLKVLESSMIWPSSGKRLL